MEIIKPTPLAKNDTIGFLTVSGPVDDFERIEKAKKYFEQKGYNVVISDTTYTKKNFLAADDNARLAQLHEFFEDSKINAIFCTRGGYGAIRLLKDLDYNLIRNNPKIFCGFSDVTALLTSIYTNAGLQTFHSPMPYPDFGVDDISELTQNSFFEIIGGKEFSVALKGKIYNSGNSNGVLWGGNLATLASMVGTYFIPPENFILFLEDVNEPAYKIDRYLTQLMYDKNFVKNLSGVVLGEFTNLDEAVFFDDIFYELGAKFQIPIMSGLHIGHVKNKLTVPLGIKVFFDTEQRVIKQIN